MEKMTHAEYIDSIRLEAGRIAAAVSMGSMSVLDGCWALGPLLARAELEPDDPYAGAIESVCSELDGLPLGEFRAHWAPEALAGLAPQLDAITEWATPLALPAILSVARRFGA